MKNSVFYSWQSDLPNPTNRTFIESAIKSAIKKVGEDVDLRSSMRDGKLKIDKDTKGVSGSPPIVDVIFNKIANCAIFVPDMTFVGKSDGGRLIPNPNVLVEYGWALRTVTHLRIVPVMNSYYGKPSWETLPFDMRHLRHPFAYELKPNPSSEEKRAAKEALVSHLVEAFKTVFETGVLDEGTNDVPFGPANMIDLVKEYVVDDRHRIKLHDLINGEVERAFAAINRDDLLELPRIHDGDEFRRRARIFEAETATVRQMLATACYWDNSGHVETWIGVFVWRKEIDGPSNVFSFFDNLAATRGGDWQLLKSGLFGGSLERFNKAKEAIDPHLKKGWMSYIR